MLPVEHAVAFKGLEGNELGIVHHGGGDNMVSTSCETFINSNPATSPSWFSGGRFRGRTMSKMCGISLWMPRIRGAGCGFGRRLGGCRGRRHQVRLLRFRGRRLQTGSPLAMPPPTRLSSLLGSTALCGLRRPIQKCQPPSVCTSPLRWTAWLMSPNGRKAAFQHKSTLPASSHTSNFSSRQPVQQSEAFPFRAPVLQTVAHRQPVVRLRQRSSEISESPSRQSCLIRSRQSGFRRPKASPFR